MTAWIAVAIGVLGIFSGMLGQAIYWGIFKGSIEARAAATEEDVVELKSSRSEMWGTINEHGERIVALETACRINSHAKGAAQ